MITLDYTVDATQAAKDFVEEGSEPLRKRKKSDVGEHDIRYDLSTFVYSIYV